MPAHNSRRGRTLYRTCFATTTTLGHYFQRTRLKDLRLILPAPLRISPLRGRLNRVHQVIGWLRPNSCAATKMSDPSGGQGRDRSFHGVADSVSYRKHNDTKSENATSPGSAVQNWYKDLREKTDSALDGFILHQFVPERLVRSRHLQPTPSLCTKFCTGNASSVAPGTGPGRFDLYTCREDTARLRQKTCMEPLQVKSVDARVKGRREGACRKVFDHLQLQLAELNLLCFIDDEAIEDEDYERERHRRLGVTNRGGFMRDVAAALAQGIPLPRYVRECLYDATGEQLFQRLIYVHGSASEPEESLIITLSHELRHLLQWEKEPEASEADSRLRGRLGNWQEHPSEHDAMLTSKQVATALCGEALVKRYADSKIELAIQSGRSLHDGRQIWQQDQARWEFFRDLEIANAYDFAREVTRLVEEHGLQLHR